MINIVVVVKMRFEKVGSSTRCISRLVQLIIEVVVETIGMGPCEEILVLMPLLYWSHPDSIFIIIRHSWSSVLILKCHIFDPSKETSKDIARCICIIFRCSAIRDLS